MVRKVFHGLGQSNAGTEGAESRVVSSILSVVFGIWHYSSRSIMFQLLTPYRFLGLIICCRKAGNNAGQGMDFVSTLNDP